MLTEKRKDQLERLYYSRVVPRKMRSQARLDAMVDLQPEDFDLDEFREETRKVVRLERLSATLRRRMGLQGSVVFGLD